MKTIVINDDVDYRMIIAEYPTRGYKGSLPKEDFLEDGHVMSRRLKRIMTLYSIDAPYHLFILAYFLTFSKAFEVSSNSNIERPIFTD